MRMQDMSIRVKRATVWRVDTRNSPGVLANTLGPLARAGQNLEVVIGYAYPDRVGAVIEVYPISTSAGTRAARQAGLVRTNLPCLHVTGDNRPGLGHAIARRLSEAGINLSFFVAQTLGPKYTGFFGFDAQSEANLAARLLRNIDTAPTRAAERRADRAAPPQRRRRPRRSRRRA